MRSFWKLIVSFAVLQLVQAACPVAPTFTRYQNVTADWDIGSYPVARFISPPDPDYTLVFRAPVGKKIQVRITMIDGGCDATCSQQGLLLKTGYPNMAEKRIFCDEDKHTVYTSTTNTFTLVAYNCEKVKTTNTKFMLESRYVEERWTAPAKIPAPAPRSKCGVILTATKDKATYVMGNDGEP